MEFKASRDNVRHYLRRKIRQQGACKGDKLTHPRVPTHPRVLTESLPEPEPKPSWLRAAGEMYVTTVHSYGFISTVQHFTVTLGLCRLLPCK